MRKKLTALLFCALLLAQLAVPLSAKASDYVYFVAAGENVLPLSDSTMPFWHGGYLYVSSSIFTGTAREALDIVNIPISDKKSVILYSVGQGKALRFDNGKSYAYDENDDTYYPGSVYRNGNVYVPISVVARFFGLQYTVTKVNSVVNGEKVQGDLAWIRQPGNTLTDKYFVDSASFVIASRYEAYLKEKEQQAASAETPSVPAGVVIEGKRIYLCLTAGENTAALLDVLDRYGAQAAFFCTPEFLEQQGDLLRRMTATGQTIGILADAGDETRTVEEQLEAGNRALEQATCGRTRLVRVHNGDEQTLQRLAEAGYRCLEPDLDRSGYDLRSASNAESLLRRVLARRGDDVTVWLADRADAVGLRNFLKDTGDGESRCLAWTETT